MANPSQEVLVGATAGLHVTEDALCSPWHHLAPSVSPQAQVMTAVTACLNPVGLPVALCNQTCHHRHGSSAGIASTHICGTRIHPPTHPLCQAVCLPCWPCLWLQDPCQVAARVSPSWQLYRQCPCSFSRRASLMAGEAMRASRCITEHSSMHTQLQLSQQRSSSTCCSNSTVVCPGVLGQQKQWSLLHCHGHALLTRQGLSC